MHTSDQILKLVNDTLDNLAYDRKPSSLYELSATSSHLAANAFAPC